MPSFVNYRVYRRIKESALNRSNRHNDENGMELNVAAVERVGNMDVEYLGPGIGSTLVNGVPVLNWSPEDMFTVRYMVHLI